MGNLQYLTIEDVAKRFSVNERTVYRLLKEGALPAFKIGSQWRFSKENLDTWVQAKTVPSSYHKFKEKILIVEDDPDVAMLLKARLKTAGFESHAELMGKAAIHYASHSMPDLVILDLCLPDMHGYEIAKRLRELYDPVAIPILMLTGMDKPTDEMSGFERGADAYLKKPYDANELLKTIRLLLGHETL